MAQVTIPNNWTPRPYQLPALQAFEAGKRRFSLQWHRRAGKDSFALQLAAIQAHKEIGTYWHLFPKGVQARKAIWHGIGADGVKFTRQAFPDKIRNTTREQEMQIELKCGSIYQMSGSDNYDTLVGSNVRGVIFSEYALCDPASWAYIRPIIRENKGWALFISTYRGKNHFYRQHQMAMKHEGWFASSLTVDQTQRHDGSPVLSPEDIEEERREGMSEAMIQQEYYGSPLAAFEGAYWGEAMRIMLSEGRITPVQREPELPVYATLDLGLDDHMAVIFLQEDGNAVRCLGSKSYRHTPIPDVCVDMKKQHPVTRVYLPHDAHVHGMNSGITREQVFRNHGFEAVVVPSPPGSKMPGIETARNLLAKTWIDEDATELIDAFTGYRTDESKSEPGVFQLKPLHSWESHLSDAWQVYAKARKAVLTSYQPLDYSARDTGQAYHYG